MRKATGMLFLFIVSFSVGAGPVYRCTGEGGVLLFTDKGCPGGRRIEEESLQPNLFTGAPVVESPVAASRPKRRKQSSGGRGSCNNAADLRHIDLMLKSLATDRRQKSFLKAERRRVQNCELEKLSAVERQRRDAALRRINALREAERDAAKAEIEGIYRAHKGR